MATTVAHLRCEYLINPEGIDEPAPRLSWQIESERRGVRQVAYRILVSGIATGLVRKEGEIWDTGRVESGQTIHVTYEGRTLQSRDVCHWQVCVWDETGAMIWSTAARWSMGLLHAEEWKAQWIAADPAVFARDASAFAPTKTQPGSPVYFRKAFDLPDAVRRATLYASARGIIECYVGGKRVGDDLFAPEWTDYRKRIHYRTYDVTSQMSAGENVLAAVLGDGWWTGYVGWQETRGRYASLENSVILQLEVVLETGERLIVGSDSSWRCQTGPILSSDFMMGETYDARRELPDWSLVTSLDQSWPSAREVAAPKAVLIAQRSQPVQITQRITPLSVKEITPGVFIYDLGQNISGWAQLKVKAAAGTTITLRFGERLSPDGTLYTENLRRAKATDVYICKGGAEEIWEPHFTFHGFQYIELTGIPEPLPVSAVTGCVIHSATPPAGHFECSNDGVNRLWLNGLWSQRDNFLSVPTDCPQRDERLGWMGDAQVFLRTASYNMDVAAFFTKWMVDVEDAQTPTGIFPDVAPRVPEDHDFVGLDLLSGAAGWADAGVIVPWTIWRVYGDRRIIERHWSAMVAWMDYLERTNPEGLRIHDLANNYGDWLCIPTDTTFRTHSPMKNLLATAYWADDAAKLARMARELGRETEAKRFQAMFERVRAAFQQEFLREDGRLTVETQTAYILALTMDLLPMAVRARAAERLVDNIEALDWHLSTGFIGISHLNPTLTLSGHADVAYRLLLQDDYPSWLYPVLHGATTIWERWNGWTEKDGFFNPQMNSFNHYSLGSIGEWLFRHVAGIELDPEVVGFDRFVLKPFVGEGLTFARATYQTMHGQIASEWKRSGDRLTWTVRIPPNTRARVSVPSEEDTQVSESGAPLEKIAEDKPISREGRYLSCDLGAGTYVFESTIRV